MHKGIRNSVLELYEGGHLDLLVDPEYFGGVIDRFLSG